MRSLSIISAVIVLLSRPAAAGAQEGTAKGGEAAAGSAFTLALTIAGDIVDFDVDNLGNIYVINGDNQLKKLGPRGDSLAVFNDVRRYGRIATVDATNPLKILVYYRDFTTVIELDRFLNIINTIDLRTLGILQAKAVGLAYDNNIWVFDELDAKLKRVADDGSLVDQSTDFRQLFDTVPDPTSVRDRDGLVYLYDTARGVYIFDHYGTLKTHLDFSGWKDFEVIGKNLLGRSDRTFYRYQPGTFDMKEEPIPAVCQDALHIRIAPALLYVLKKTGLEVYTRK